MHKTIKKLLEDGVLISKFSLYKMGTLFEANPDLETDVIEIHKLAQRKRYGVKWEEISLSDKDKIDYEMCVSDTKTARKLLSAIDKLSLKSNIMICIEAFDDCNFIFYHPKHKEAEKEVCLV